MPTGTNGNDTLTGTSGSDILEGLGGNDILNGLGGIDQTDGGTGNDRHIIDNPGDLVIEDPSEGTDTVETSVAYTLAANVENLTLTGSGSFNGTGNALANLIIGNSGNNSIDGAAGADTMRGGLGDDHYFIDNAGDTVVEQSGEGTDDVVTMVSYTLASNLENLTLSGDNAINGTGNNLANSLVGNADPNILDGGFGADTMAGFDGNDTYIVDNAGDVVTEVAAGGTGDTVQSSLNYTLGAELEKLVLTGTGNLVGTGNSLANTLTGNSGANRLDGGAGGDMMIGGLGNDSYVVDNSLDQVGETTGGGIDTIYSSISHDIDAEVENLILTGTAAINCTGNPLANTITGNDAANRLDGGLGADILKGGLGDDTYLVNQATDLVSELAGQGTDTVLSIGSYTLADAVENLTLLNVDNSNATGNQFTNVLIGNSGANRIDGRGGADTMNGRNGNDTYVVDNAGDIVVESSTTGGTDMVESSVGYTLGSNVENLTLTGTAAISGTGNASVNILVGNGAANILDGKAGNDQLSGGGGNDTLIGGTGNDMLDGAAGADRFTFQDALIAANADHVVLLETGVDKIALENAVFTGLATGALPAGAFVIGTAAADAGDRIIYDSATGSLYFDSDGTGAAAAILFATLDNAPATVSANDFVVT